MVAFEVVTGLTAGHGGDKGEVFFAILELSFAALAAATTDCDKNLLEIDV